MLVASWNINSIRSRHEQFLQWLDEQCPDIVALQETRVPDCEFPYAALRERGYKAIHSPGQGGRSGVALVFRGEASAVSFGVGGQHIDRVLKATIDKIAIVNIYAPSRRSSAKVELLQALRMELLARPLSADALLLCGDFNCSRSALVKPERTSGMRGRGQEGAEEIAFRQLVHELKLIDVVRPLSRSDAVEAWLDLEREARTASGAMRIDYILATEQMACTRAWVDGSPMGRRAASDHAPVCAVFED